MFAPNGLYKRLFPQMADRKQIRDLESGERYRLRQKAAMGETLRFFASVG
jgi:hypothetical protein